MDYFGPTESTAAMAGNELELRAKITQLLA